MRIIFYLLTFLILSTVSFAFNADKLVKEGIQLFRSKNYSEALLKLNLALDDKSLNKSSFSSAYYYRGVTYIALAKTNTCNVKEPYLLAYNDLVRAQKEDDFQKEWSGISAEKLAEIKPDLIKRALFIYKTEAQNNFERANLCKLYFEALSGLFPNDYVFGDYIGQCQLLMHDTSSAVTSFLGSQAKAIEISDGKVDVAMGYSFYRLAKLYGLKMNDLDKGLLVLSRGRNYLKGEMKELEKSKLTLKIEEYNVVQAENNDLLGLYTRLELELSTQGNKGYLRTVKNYEHALLTKEDDIPVLIAYATFLEDKNSVKAEALYNKVIALDSLNFNAFYGIGSLYLSQGGVFMQKAHKAKTNDKVQYFNNMGRERYRKAIQAFVRATEINSSNEVLIPTILQLSKAVGDTVTYKKYNKNMK